MFHWFFMLYLFFYFANSIANDSYPHPTYVITNKKKKITLQPAYLRPLPTQRSRFDIEISNNNWYISFIYIAIHAYRTACIDKTLSWWEKCAWNQVHFYKFPSHFLVKKIKYQDIPKQRQYETEL